MLYTAIVAAFIIGVAAGAVIRRKGEIEPRYIDRSGIPGNPAVSFIDVWTGKVINIIFGKWKITFSQIPAPEGINILHILSGCHAGLRNAIKETEGKVSPIDQKTYILYYSSIIELIYRLSAPHINIFKRYFYRKALKRQAMENVAWLLDVVENLVDYWSSVKKKIELLSQGKTLFQTVGARYTWSSYSVDGEGMISIKPRFAKSSKRLKN